MNENEKQIQDLLVAVVKMEKTQEVSIESQKTTTTNVDKLVAQMGELLPVHVDISNIKKMLYSSITVAILYGAWATIELHRMDTILQSYIAADTIKTDNNKNQITYCKGRITGLNNQIKSPNSNGVKINQSVGN